MLVERTIPVDAFTFDEQPGLSETDPTNDASRWRGKGERSKLKLKLLDKSFFAELRSDAEKAAAACRTRAAAKVKTPDFMVPCYKEELSTCRRRAAAKMHAPDFTSTCDRKDSINDYDPAKPQYIQHVSESEAKALQAQLVHSQLIALERAVESRKAAGAACGVTQHYEQVIEAMSKELAMLSEDDLMSLPSTDIPDSDRSDANSHCSRDTYHGD